MITRPTTYCGRIGTTFCDFVVQIRRDVGRQVTVSSSIVHSDAIRTYRIWSTLSALLALLTFLRIEEGERTFVSLDVVSAPVYLPQTHGLTQIIKD